MIAHTSAVEHSLVVLVGLSAGLVYGRAWLRQSRSGPLPLVSFLSGMTILVISVTPSIERWAQNSFTGHMAQHLMMIVLAAPLIVLAEPIRTIRPLIGSVVGSFMRPTPRERAIGRWWRAKAPMVAAAAFVATLWLTHLTTMYDEALTRRWLHDLEHVMYVSTAMLLWAVLRGGGHRAAPARIGAVFAVIGSSALLGMVLLSATSPLIATYAERLGDEAALDDQRRAASLMWVGGMATTLPLLIASVWSWASAEQRMADRTDDLTTRGAGREVRPGSVDLRG